MCEGAFDVLALLAAGVSRVVARKRNKFMCYDLRDGKILMPVMRDRGGSALDTSHKPR